MRINIDDLKFKFKFKDDPEMPATMVLIVGQFEIRGFTVRKSKFDENAKRYVLYPPANRSASGKWIKIFWTELKEEWELLEKRALKQFEEEQTDKYLRELGSPKEEELPV
ncbi:MAG: hypothetical protein WCT22_03280 [Patescibacteria group bacterium]|jgi:hypothetical protein